MPGKETNPRSKVARQSTQRPSPSQDQSHNMRRADAPPSGLRPTFRVDSPTSDSGQQHWGHENEPRNYLQQPGGLQQPHRSSINPQNNSGAGRGTVTGLNQLHPGLKAPAGALRHNQHAPQLHPGLKAPAGAINRIQHAPQQPPAPTVNYQYPIRTENLHTFSNSSRPPPTMVRPQYPDINQQHFVSSQTAPNDPRPGIVHDHRQPQRDPVRLIADPFYQELWTQMDRKEESIEPVQQIWSNKWRAEPCYRCGCAHGPGQCHSDTVLDKCRLCGIADHSLTLLCPKLATYSQIRMMLDRLASSREPTDRVDAARVILMAELALGRKRPVERSRLAGRR
jgi:hypothetical protein